ncbi:MAG: hypothetical protein MN733_16240 [Nitrososphaera sp.]|nr:hypothetical protein [Nitrososphaera sp.]
MGVLLLTSTSFLSVRLGSYPWFQPAAAQESESWEKYNDSFMGIEVSYPNGWSTDSAFLNYIYDVTLFSELEGSNDPYDERVIIMMEKLPASMSLDEFTDPFIESLELAESFEIVEQTSSELDGYSGRSVVFTAKDPEADIDLMGISTWTVVNSRAYILVAYAEESSYSAYLPTFNEIIASFKITNLNPPEKEPHYTSYTDDSNGFKIDYETTWELSTEAEYMPTADTAIAFYSPWHGPVFNGGLFFVEIIEEIPSSTSLSDYTDEIIDNRREVFYSFRLLDSRQTSLSGNDAHQIAYTWSLEGQLFKEFEAWTLQGNRAYHLIFTSELQVYDQYETILQHLVASFELEGSDSSAGATLDTEVEYLQYENSDFGVRIQYPNTWSKVTGQDFLVMFTSPYENFGDEFTENVLISVNDLPYSITLEDYTKNSISSLRSAYSSFQVIESDENALLSGHAAYSISAVAHSEGIKFQVYAIWTLLENREYFILFTAENEQYDKVYSGHVRKMVDSLEIDESTLVSGFYLYADETHGIKAEYPAGWEVSEEFKSGESPTIKFASEKDFKLFTINISPLAWNMSLDEYAKILPWEMSEFIYGFKLVETTQTTLSGTPSYKVVFTGVFEVPEQTSPDIQPVAFSSSSTFKTTTADGGKTVQVKGAVVFTIRDSLVYSVSYLTFATGYLDFVNTANRMIGSVDIDPSVISEKLSGTKFSDSESGLELGLPSGWTGYRSSYDNVTRVIIVPGNDGSREKVSILLDIRNLSDVLEDEEKTDSPCEPIKESHVVFVGDGIKMFRHDQDCEIYGQNAKTKSYATFTLDKFVTLNLVAESELAYDETIEIFEGVVKSTVLDGALDLSSDRNDHLFGTSSYNHTVTALNATYNVHVSSSSNVTDFIFDEAQKSVSFKVHGETGTSGSASVMLFEVLEAPYVVTIDGVETDDYVIIYDETTNSSGIQIYYSHSSREVAITGTSVVPEFPAASALMLSVSILAIIIMILRQSGRIPWLGKNGSL